MHLYPDKVQFLLHVIAALYAVFLLVVAEL